MSKILREGECSRGVKILVTETGYAISCSFLGASPDGKGSCLKFPSPDSGESRICTAPVDSVGWEFDEE